MRPERRHAQRFRIDQMIELSYGREESLRCQGVDLSEIGVLCRTERALEPGARVFLLMSLGPGEDDEPVSTEGVVVRSTPSDWGFESGVAFTGMAPELRTRLKEYLAHCPRA
jgi:hypothetical protein